MRYFSMFSGVGGFELGIKRATKGKWKCIGYSEIDKYAIQTYQKHFKHKNYGDAKHIDWPSVPNFNMLCAGFPCQAFSVAGRRKGFNDTRGTLFFEICRAVKDKKFDYLFLENVKGLCNHEQGNTFRTILRSLDELGYDAEWQILNSKHFGVPQNRERVFIIGHLRKKGFRQIFPIRESKGIFDKKDRGKQKERKRICSTIDSRYGALRNAGETYIMQHSRDKKGKIIRYNKRNLAGTLKQPSGNTQNYLSQNNQIRRLTPIECERLQGFPDDWTKGVSETQRYKQLGNAVTVNVIEAIINQWSKI